MTRAHCLEPLEARPLSRPDGDATGRTVEAMSKRQRTTKLGTCRNCGGVQFLCAGYCIDSLTCEWRVRDAAAEVQRIEEKRSHAAE